jgi:hypothetical protein
MQYEGGELLYECVLVEFCALAELVVEFFDGEAVEVGEEEGRVVFLE